MVDDIKWDESNETKNEETNLQIFSIIIFLIPKNYLNIARMENGRKN